mmetsp:Transcript_7021/g.22069  ORF Transcript_7021/g.22069 Transcript_7021/m.22069 type:complete len:321 (+) Transcript_7021:531-1493(+)
MVRVRRQPVLCPPVRCRPLRRRRSRRRGGDSEGRLGGGCGGGGAGPRLGRGGQARDVAGYAGRLQAVVGGAVFGRRRARRVAHGATDRRLRQPRPHARGVGDAVARHGGRAARRRLCGGRPAVLRVGDARRVRRGEARPPHTGTGERSCACRRSRWGVAARARTRALRYLLAQHASRRGDGGREAVGPRRRVRVRPARPHRRREARGALVRPAAARPPLAPAGLARRNLWRRRGGGGGGGAPTRGGCVHSRVARGPPVFCGAVRRALKAVGSATPPCIENRPIMYLKPSISLGAQTTVSLRVCSFPVSCVVPLPVPDLSV